MTFDFVYDGITMTSSTVVKWHPDMSAREAAKWMRGYPAGTETAGYLDGDIPNDVALVRENDFRLPLMLTVLALAARLFLL